MSGHNHFVVRASKFRIVFRAIVTLGLPLVVIMMNLFDFHLNLEPESVSALKGGLIIFAVIFLFSLICAISWKYTIEGNEIHYRTLFRRGTITFSDIKRVWLYRRGNRRLNHRAVERRQRVSIFEWRNNLDFHCENVDGWLLPSIPETADGYHLFVGRLKARKIPGAKSL